MTKYLKKNKLIYYVEGFYRNFLSNNKSDKIILELEKQLTKQQIKEVEQRVAYYNKINFPVKLNHSFSNKVKDLRIPHNPKTYYFDTYEYARYFNADNNIVYLFGDVIHVPDIPSIVKSRPIEDNNQNSVLLNLDKARHFTFIKNDKPLSEKQNMLIGRASIYQQHRIDFYQKYFGHRLCDLGQVNEQGGNPDWIKPKMNVIKHLDYKFILSLQGNDVATNLKWIMSSNSLAVMPSPTLETWFMEGKLVGNEHFIEIKSDYSNLIDQLEYYTIHTNEAQQIIENAHQHCQKFFNPKVEKLCSLLVLKQYFDNCK